MFPSSVSVVTSPVMDPKWKSACRIFTAKKSPETPPFIPFITLSISCRVSCNSSKCRKLVTILSLSEIEVVFTN